MQDNLIDQGVDGGCCSDPQRERQHGCGRKRRTVEKRPYREAKVIREVPQPSAQPDIADPLPNLCDAADFQSCLPPGLGLRQTRKHEVTHTAIDVVLQFAVQIVLQVSKTEPVQQLLDHESPSLKIN